MKINSRIAGRLKSGYEPDNNFPLYFENTFALYARYALIKLVLNYASLKFRKKDDPMVDEEFDRICGEDISAGIDSLVKSITDNAEDISKIPEDMINEARRLHDRLINVQEYLLINSSKLSKCEYALNRIEYRFKPSGQRSVRGIIDETMMYLFEDKSDLVINDKLSFIIPQVPVRITKQRVLQRVNDVVKLYDEDTKEAFDYYIYRVAGACGINFIPSKGFDHDFALDGIEDIYSKDCEQLLGYKYSSLDKEAYEEADGRFKDLSERMVNANGICPVYEEIVNSLINVFICAGNNVQFNGTKLYEEIVNILKELLNGGYEEEALYERLGIFEGIQEEDGPECEYMASQIDDIRAANEEYISGSEYAEKGLKDIKLCSMLTSSSSFVDLEPSADKDDRLSEEYRNEITEKLMERLNRLLSTEDRIIRRSYIASVLSQLPNEFRTAEQIRNYMTNAFELCSDPAEREGSLAAMELEIRGKA